MREPSCANARAVARPIPVRAPVIKTTRVFISALLKVQKCKGCSCAIDIVLHCRHPDRPDNFSVYLNGKPSTPRCHRRKRGDAGQKRRVALDKVEKVLCGDA